MEGFYDTMHNILKETEFPYRALREICIKSWSDL